MLWIYTANENSTVSRIKISDAAVDLAWASLAAIPQGLIIDDSYIYTANQNNTVSRIPISNPAGVDLAWATLAPDAFPVDLVAVGIYIFTLNSNNTVSRILISNPTEPDLAWATLAPDANPRALVINGLYIYTANQNNTISRIKISDAAVDLAWATLSSTTLVADNTDIYTANSTTIGQIEILETPVVNPTWATLSQGTLNNLTIDGNDLYASSTGGLYRFSLIVVCYAAGTKILTKKGYVAIEDLQPKDKLVVQGNIVTDESGEQKITPNSRKCMSVVWKGHFTITSMNRAAYPVCIKAHALGENKPFEDLYVSPGHRIQVGEQLVEACKLINKKTIIRDKKRQSVTYYHIELKNHSIICANGVFAESYADVSNRSAFQATCGTAVRLKNR